MRATHQHDVSRLHEQRPQVLVAAPGDLAQDRAVAGRLLLRHQPEPGAEVPPLLEPSTRADRRHHGDEMIGPTPGTLIRR